MKYKYCENCGTKNDINCSKCIHCGLNFKNENEEKNIIDEIKQEEEITNTAIENYFNLINIIAPIFEFILCFNYKVRILFPILICIVLVLTYMTTKYKYNIALYNINTWVNRLIFIIGIIACTMAFI